MSSAHDHAPRLARIDGVRAIAALSVVCFHVWLYRDNRPHGRRTALLDQALVHASTGLICFFVLSGYLLYRAFARGALGGSGPVALGTYARRRAARIVPAYWVCLAGCLALYAAAGLDELLPAARELPLHALFLQNYSGATMGDVNPVAWTLCVEMAFYALLPVVGWAALRLGPGRVRAQAALLVGLIAISPVWNVLAQKAGWEDLGDRALPAFLGCFGVGMLLALWAEHRGDRAPLRPRATLALVAAAALLVVGDAVWQENGWWLRGGLFGIDALSPRVQYEAVGHLVSAAGFALLVAAATTGSGSGAAWLGSRPLAAIGEVSYGLYLWHLPLLLVARTAGLLPHALVPRLAVVLTLSLLAAAASWRFVERPWIERTHRRRGARRPYFTTAPYSSKGTRITSAQPAQRS